MKFMTRAEVLTAIGNIGPSDQWPENCPTASMIFYGYPNPGPNSGDITLQPISHLSLGGLLARTDKDNVGRFYVDLRK